LFLALIAGDFSHGGLIDSIIEGIVTVVRLVR